MESIQQEHQPQVSVVERQKQEASLFVAKRVKLLIAEGDSVLSAVHKVYEEVKGNDYRKEQATAKLLEALAMQNELDMRKNEIQNISPELGSIINYEAVANDKKYSVAV